MVDYGNRNTPPGQKRVHGGSEQPGGKQVPVICAITYPAFGSEQAGYACKIDPAEGEGQDGGPPYTPETQVAQQIGQSKIGCMNE